jgi:hypothetical protein
MFLAWMRMCAVDTQKSLPHSVAFSLLARANGVSFFDGFRHVRTKI